MKFFGFLLLAAIAIIVGLYFYGLSMTPETRRIEVDTPVGPAAAEDA